MNKVPKMITLIALIGLLGVTSMIVYGIAAAALAEEYSHKVQKSKFTNPITRCFYSEEKNETVWVEMGISPEITSGGMTLPSMVMGEFRYLIKDQKPIIGSYWVHDRYDIAISKGKGLLGVVFIPRADDIVSPSNEEQLWEYMFRMDENYLEVGIGERERTEGLFNYSGKKPTYHYYYKDSENITTWKKIPEVSCEVLNSKTGITKYDRPDIY